MSKKLQVIFGLVIVVSILLGLFIKSISSNHSENFEDFNRKFHSDSIFQLSRINFPIEGKLIEGFEKQNWTSKNWELMKIPVSEKSLLPKYKHSVRKTDEVVVEKFWIDNSDFLVERKFKEIDGKWFLIYYNDVNL
ncbi:hypothetical protein C3L50_12445 [Flavobacterium alvei]|uniref:DUF4348 domain-containing protein n=1 Tax=Flavobacterium alvei TaxID=2080416 RepID=A0A2S5A674_9FLAO|nr:hypothetical protein [Flavobacterium alvei]POY38078.1 hypothetical protein C3L50_12445 [Flavobacterium alvei]